MSRPGELPERRAASVRAMSWNLERKHPDSPRGSEAIEHLFAQRADVMALTEVRTSFPLRDGHALWCEPPRGSTFADDERKVMIWSRAPWREVDRIGNVGLDPTRFIGATTDSPIGPIRVLGVCIPWHMAEVRYPIDVKRKPWELHIRFLQSLRGLLAACEVPTIVAGDFNQAVPRVAGGRRDAALAMAETFESFDIVTRGQLPGCDRPGIDHIAVSSHLSAIDVWGWPNDVTGKRLTDHDGAAASLVRA